MYVFAPASHKPLFQQHFFSMAMSHLEKSHCGPRSQWLAGQRRSVRDSALPPTPPVTPGSCSMTPASMATHWASHWGRLLTGGCQRMLWQVSWSWAGKTGWQFDFVSQGALLQDIDFFWQSKRHIDTWSYGKREPVWACKSSQPTFVSAGWSLEPEFSTSYRN